MVNENVNERLLNEDALTVVADAVSSHWTLVRIELEQMLLEDSSSLGSSHIDANTEELTAATMVPYVITADLEEIWRRRAGDVCREAAEEEDVPFDSWGVELATQILVPASTISSVCTAPSRLLQGWHSWVSSHPVVKDIDAHCLSDCSSPLCSSIY
jgi:hypothetical protein